MYRIISRASLIIKITGESVLLFECGRPTDFMRLLISSVIIEIRLVSFKFDTLYNYVQKV